MEKRGVSAMDAWDWEVLPEEHRSFYAETRPAAASHGGGGGEVPLADQETEEPILFPSEDGCKDIGVVPSPETGSAQEEEPMVPPPPTVVTQLPVPDVDGEEEEEDKFQSSGTKKKADDGKPEEFTGDQEKFQSSGTKKEADDGKPEEFTGDQEEEEITKKKVAAPCVGKLKVNGIGALCSFGVAAAAVCVFLVGGKLQHHHHQQQKLQLQFLGDDKTSRLNQAMSSVMGAAGADISFGGFYDAF